MRSLSESQIKEAIEGHLAQNRELEKLITEKGVDLTKTRTIDLHFWALNEKSAHDLALALDALGYPTSIKARVGNSELWNVESQVEASPLGVTAPFFVERLVRLAQDHGAEFDGWGTAI
jgi:hypothetical protein